MSDSGAIYLGAVWLVGLFGRNRNYLSFCDCFCRFLDRQFQHIASKAGVDLVVLPCGACV